MSHLVLAFDTASDTLAIALGVRDGLRVELVATLDFPARREANLRLLESVAQLLDDNGRAVRDLSEVVVGHGPGSFTGVRIGVASAKGLAHGLGIPLYGVSTLDAIAWRLADRDALVGVVADAMRGEVYPVLFRTGARTVERLGPDRVMRPEQAAREFAACNEPLVLTGDGLAKYAEVFSAVLGTGFVMAEESLWTPSGAGLLDAYQAALMDGSVGDGDPALVLPVYTRLSDAEENEQRRNSGGSL